MYVCFGSANDLLCECFGLNVNECVCVCGRKCVIVLPLFRQECDFL